MVESVGLSQVHTSPVRTVSDPGERRPGGDRRVGPLGTEVKPGKKVRAPDSFSFGNQTTTTAIPVPQPPTVVVDTLRTVPDSSQTQVRLGTYNSMGSYHMGRYPNFDLFDHRFSFDTNNWYTGPRSVKWRKLKI